MSNPEKTKISSIDFSSEDSRWNFLENKLNDLKEGVSDNYSRVFMDELVKRLNQTIDEFNKDVKVMIKKLQERNDPDFTPVLKEQIIENEGGIDISAFDRELEAVKENLKQ